MNLILCGFMGCGKTTVASILGSLTGREVADTDEMVEQTAGMPVAEIFSLCGESAFRELEYEACRKIATKKNWVVSTGGGALTYQRNVDALRQSGKIVLLDVPFEVIRDRVRMDGSRPLFRDLKKAQALYRERYALYERAADVRVNGNQMATRVASDILKAVKL